MQALLERQRIFGVIRSPIPAAPTRVWNDSDMQARSVIILCVGDDQLVHIADLPHARDMWQALRRIHMREAAGTALLHFEKLTNFRLKPDGDLQAHLTQMQYLRRQMAERNFLLDEAIFCFMIINSLDQRFKTVASQLGSLPAQDLTVQLICAALLNENGLQPSGGLAAPS
ncbi:Hypothetical predicted protein [Podarcis lilfordi]|uniref:Uncharacterized protein n=1 Tax=Podarcis lilfordi TaxID=74358 RepID=A0AA35LN30_9SAUR|nr:Hypothetical predicted protein [Podarcis lilfordi]